MDRHFDKLSISASGLLGDRHNQPHHYQTLPQPHHYAQQQHQPVRQPQAPPSVYGSTRPLENGVRSQESGDAAEHEDQHEPVRQRTGRVRQSRSSTWGSGANGQASSTSATSATVAHAAELDETVDLRRRTPSQAESPRTPRTPGSPRYVTTGPDDQHHLASISPRGAAGATSAHHSYQRRDRHPSSSSGGGGNLMVTEDDFRHAREANSHAVGGGSDFGWQQPARGGPEDVSTRLLQKYKTDSLRVEVTDADRRRQQQHPAGLSKSHDGFVVPRRLPPIGASSAANHEDYDDDDDIECDGGGDGSGGDGEANVGESQRRNQRRQQRQQRQHQDEDQSGGGHKGRTRTN